MLSTIMCRKGLPKTLFFFLGPSLPSANEKNVFIFFSFFFGGGGIILGVKSSLDSLCFFCFFLFCFFFVFVFLDYSFSFLPYSFSFKRRERSCCFVISLFGKGATS